MPKLSIVASNRNRFDINTDISKFFIKSFEHSKFKDFELIIADGGSDNYEEIKSLEGKLPFKFRVVTGIIGERFERAKLNNVGVRQADSEYIMTTDVDMLFVPAFFENVMKVFETSPNAFVESRTMYLKNPWVKNHIYNGKIDPFVDPDAIRCFRVKKRTTAGGCQCTRRLNWEQVRGFDESMKGWGSEDYDLLTRISSRDIPVVWLGEGKGGVEVFHQPHNKTKAQVSEDLDSQDKNKRILKMSASRTVNKDEWGGVSENI